MGAAFFNGNPRAKKLMGKELLVEFAWCEAYAETLSRFTEYAGEWRLRFQTASHGPSDPKYCPETTSPVKAAALRTSVGGTAATDHARRGRQRQRSGGV